jgi:hypothetical protein
MEQLTKTLLLGLRHQFGVPSLVDASAEGNRESWS